PRHCPPRPTMLNSFFASKRFVGSPISRLCALPDRPQQPAPAYVLSADSFISFTPFRPCGDGPAQLFTTMGSRHLVHRACGCSHPFHCFGPIRGPSPMGTYPCGGVPLFSRQNARAEPARASTAAMEADPESCGTTVVQQLNPALPDGSVAR